MSTIRLQRDDSLPPLAWLCRIRPGREVSAWFGRSVEIVDNGLFEGCYAGRWDEDNFLKASHVFGSGFRLSPDGVWVVTPSHMLEAVYFLESKVEGLVSVSNSLPALLESGEVALPGDFTCMTRFASVVYGIDDYDTCLFDLPKGRVTRVIYDNVLVTPEGELRPARKSESVDFDDYARYVGFLESTLGSAFANASDPRRTSTYTPLATCSSGYDSAACAVLAARLGCREAVTLSHARGGGHDSGARVAKALGLAVAEYPRPAAVRDLSEAAPFLASGMGGEDYCFLPFGPVLPGRILLTGFHGGALWGGKEAPNTVLARIDLCGSSLQEFRIQQEFLHIPVPIIGARHHSRIDAISRSSEMEPFRLHTGYDKPIARRLLEESGVPRELFGQTKKAGSVLLFCDQKLMAEALDSSSVFAAPMILRMRKAVRLAVRRSRVLLYRLAERGAGRLPALEGLPPRIVSDWRVFEHEHPAAFIHFMAGLSVTRRRYVSLRGAKGAGPDPGRIELNSSAPTSSARNRQRGIQLAIVDFLRSHLPDRLKSLAHAVSPWLRRRLLSDRRSLEDQFTAVFGRAPDFATPMTFNEKVNWRKLYDRNPLHRLVTDKVAVRGYVASRVDADYLVPLLGVFDKPEDIPWARLAAPYVIKATHGSGWNVFFADPVSLEPRETLSKLRRWLRTDYYPPARQWAYKEIPRRLIVERFVGGTRDTMPEDFKFFCFDGLPQLIQVDHDRFTYHTRTMYDMSWQALPVEYAYPSGPIIPAPAGLPEMVRVASELSQGFDFVRVDLYCVEGRVYFGELTVYPEAGYGRFTPPEWDERLGAFWSLPSP